MDRAYRRHPTSWLRRRSIGWIIGCGVAAVLSACSGADDAAEAGESDPSVADDVDSVVAEAPSLSGPASFERPPSAIYDRYSDVFPAPLIDLDELLPGGPPPDGITPLDDPQFIPASEVAFLADQDAVLVLEIDGDARAFPTHIMIWHEIANTEVAGVPVTVSYCPLCNTAVAYARTHADGTVMDFGTSGLLYRSSLVMFDRQTASLWTHFDGRAVHGVLTGNQLPLYPIATVSFADFVAAHPEGLVLSRETGMARNYGQNPYAGYDTGGNGTLYPATFDDSLAPARERVVAVRRHQSVAIFQEHLAAERVVAFTVDDVEMVALLEPGTATPLQANLVSLGRDVGATGVFEASLDGRPIELRPLDGGGFTDVATGSEWNVFGMAVAGELAGRRLRPVEHLDTFWFAIATFRPDTVLIGGESADLSGEAGSS